MLMWKELAALEQEMTNADFKPDYPLYIVEGECRSPLVFAGNHRGAVAFCVSLVGVRVKNINIRGF